MAAGGEDSSAARAAIARLCEKYWYPLYAFARRQGLDPDDARDVTQGFLASLLERRDIENVRQERGRFRSFLLASLKHFMTNEATRRLTQKRGGGEVILSLEFGSAEGRYSFEPAESVTPEILYERRWALTIIERVLAQSSWQEWEVSGRGGLTTQSVPSGETPDGGYVAVAEKLNTTEGAVRTAIHRLRRKFQARLRHDIVETVSDPADVEDELQYLVRALKGTMA